MTPEQIVCERCYGTGKESQSNGTICTRCQGHGVMAVVPLSAAPLGEPVKSAIEQMPADVRAEVDTIEARWQKATDVPLTAIRYEHGGGRLYVDGERRQLVLDAYEEHDREFYFSAYSDVARLLELLYATPNLRASRGAAPLGHAGTDAPADTEGSAPAPAGGTPEPPEEPKESGA